MSGCKRDRLFCFCCTCCHHSVLTVNILLLSKWCCVRYTLFVNTYATVMAISSEPVRKELKQV